MFVACNLCMNVASVGHVLMACIALVFEMYVIFMRNKESKRKESN